jgi:hypothetical protein
MRITAKFPAALLIALAVGTASAGEGLGGEAGFFLGLVFPDSDVVAQSSSSAEFTIGGRAGSVVSQRWTAFVDGTYAELDTETDFGPVSELTGRAGLEYLFLPEARYGWFLNGGVGWVSYDYDVGGNLDFHRPLGSAGFGQAIRWGSTKRVRWEWRTDFTLDKARLDHQSVVTGRLIVGLSWGPASKWDRPEPRHGQTYVYSAGIVTAKDLDGDGVKNGNDQCPQTPLGAMVDGAGCPRDRDGDGVYDGLDNCHGTPARSAVDEHGCLADSDGDGVHDGSDACPNTPTGAVVDAWGCPEDGDADGVADGLDACPRTPFGAHVDPDGCKLDGDGDGVPDGLDRCDETPAGTPVDRRGCALDPEG